MKLEVIRKILLMVSLFSGIIIAQFLYDSEREKIKVPRQTPPSSLVRSFDLGLHSAASAYFWLDNRTQLPFLPYGFEQFNKDLSLINELDPKLKTPYIFTTQVITDKNPELADEAIKIGEKGIAQSDPDYRIPFNVAAIYYIEKKDPLMAAKYFDKAALTPGIPEIVRRYCINYGIDPKYRKQTAEIWDKIYRISENKTEKERALLYIEHYRIINFLQNAVKGYENLYAQYPDKISQLIDKGIITSIPKDPFGFNFAIYDGVVGIAKDGML